MNKSELINELSERTGFSKKHCEMGMTAAIEIITETLETGDKVQLVGFGVFDVKERPARMGRNPKNMEQIEIPAARVPRFKAGKALKDAIAD